MAVLCEIVAQGEALQAHRKYEDVDKSQNPFKDQLEKYSYYMADLSSDESPSEKKDRITRTIANFKKEMKKCSTNTQ